MKSNIPAFPQPTPVGNMPNEAGMTLRDYFAGQALPAVSANDWYKRQPNAAKEIAQDCYKIADAMLAEREKSNEK